VGSGQLPLGSVRAQEPGRGILAWLGSELGQGRLGLSLGWTHSISEFPSFRSVW
jgi:hypothetical protein